MAGWIQMPLGMQVGLVPRDIVLDGDPAPLPKKGQSPANFRLMSIVATVAHLSYCWALVIFQITLSKVTDFNDFWCIKSWENLLSIACTFATSPVYYSLGKSKKVIFSSIIHTCFGLFTLSPKKTNCYHLTDHTWKMSPHYLMKCKTFSSDCR